MFIYGFYLLIQVTWYTINSIFHITGYYTLYAIYGCYIFTHPFKESKVILPSIKEMDVIYLPTPLKKAM